MRNLKINPEAFFLVEDRHLVRFYMEEVHRVARDSPAVNSWQ